MLLQSEEKRGRAIVDEVDDANVPAVISDTGCERELNEDRYAVVDSPSGLAWLLCDGMGGAAGGELAAQLAIDSMRRDLETLPFRTSENALRSAVLEANRIIVLRRQNPAFSSMGTTVVGVLFVDQEICIAHVGDSRAYLVRDGAIQQLTVDHTYVQELVDRGEIRAEEALAHPQAHILTRCVGAEPGLEVTFNRYWIWPARQNEPKDFLMLCTDGLYSLVSDNEIAQVISESSPQRACTRLVEMAKSRGGYDNITLAIVPLDGQLKNEPPQGFKPRQVAAEREKAKEGLFGVGIPAPSFQGPIRSVLIVGGLSILAALLTVMAFCFGFLR